MKLINLAAATLLPTLAYASPITVDFSQGTLGDLGTNDITVQGVRVQSVGGNLYRWRGEHCCEHVDLGLGVLGRGEEINAAEPELNPGEFLRLTLPQGYLWNSLEFSSINNNAVGIIYESIYPAGPTNYFYASQADSFHFLTVNILNPRTPYIWIVPNISYPKDNFFLLSKITLTEVPEPTTLFLLGTGLLGIGWRFRR